jgi:hypothetical protein
MVVNQGNVVSVDAVDFLDQVGAKAAAIVLLEQPLSGPCA